MAKTQVDAASHLALVEAPCQEGEVRRHPKHDFSTLSQCFFFPPPTEEEKSSPASNTKVSNAPYTNYKRVGYLGKNVTSSKMRKKKKSEKTGLVLRLNVPLNM